MRTMMAGLTGWARLERARSEELCAVDSAITVVGTLLLAATCVMLWR